MSIISFKLFKKTPGFTLIEIMVVVIIIGILAGLAIPNYVNTREKALDKEAVAGVKLIRAADRQYYVQNETYFPSSGTATLADINGNLSIALSGATWTYSLTRLGGGGINATAVHSGRTWWVTNDTAEPVCTGAACL